LATLEKPPLPGNRYALLAELHVQEQRKMDKWFGEDDTDDWLAEFEKLALQELRKLRK